MRIIPEGVALSQIVNDREDKCFSHALHVNLTLHAMVLVEFYMYIIYHGICGTGEGRAHHHPIARATAATGLTPCVISNSLGHLGAYCSQMFLLVLLLLVHLGVLFLSFKKMCSRLPDTRGLCF